MSSRLRSRASLAADAGAATASTAPPPAQLPPAFDIDQAPQRPFGMRVKVISRAAWHQNPAGAGGVRRVAHNVDPVLHPFERAREYTRALNAVKLDRLFAAPFIAALSDHTDSVTALHTRHPTRLTCALSASANGELRVWNLAWNKAIWSRDGAHQGAVRGLAMAVNGRAFFSAGVDKMVHMWQLDFDEPDTTGREPHTSYFGRHAFTGIDHQLRSQQFATSGGAVIEVWNSQRSEALQSFEWGSDSVTSVRFNPVQLELLASTATDRSVVLYDVRANSALKKLVLAMKSNAVAWNPMEAFHFTVANEDHNCYTFDMRRMDHALVVHKDHVSAVLDVDYSPTGAEFVTGSYDRTIRIFESGEGRSREVYHTKRMQRIYTVRFSSDAAYVLSGSDDTNVRLWKAQASRPVGVVMPRVKERLDYGNKLKERFKHLPDIRRIMRYRRVPKPIYNAARLKLDMKRSAARKERNRQRYTKADKLVRPNEKKSNIVAMEE